MSDESFLSRWSRLKRKEAESHPPAGEPESAPVPAVAEPAAPPPEAIEADEQDSLKDLPPVESLTAESDFTPFLRAGVPEDLHRQALRKLWTSDPIFANDDGLKDYAGDYTGLFSGTGVIKTAYRVGKGFLDAAEEAAERAEETAGQGCDTLAASAQTASTPIEEKSIDESHIAQSPCAEGDMIRKT